MALVVRGDCGKRLFGLVPAERLERQLASLPCDLDMVADASAVVSEGALQWLQRNPGVVLVSSGGRPLAWAQAKGASLPPTSALPETGRTVTSGSADYFNRKLRRREPIFGLSIEETSVARAERQLFDSVYKGVTDLVTKWAWPVPAFHLTRLLAALGVTPNAVTCVGIAFMALAAYLFAGGHFAAGLAAAWLMTFLDTVDGKLARVTLRSSRLGDRLDHWTDLAHPPVWWACVSLGIATGSEQAAYVHEATAVILVSYFVGRLAEIVFKRRLGFNPYIWRPFDAAFRLVIARRNTILLFLTLGAVTGGLAGAWLAAAAWAVLSTAIQCFRLFQGLRQSPIASYLCTEEDTLLVSLSPKAAQARVDGGSSRLGADPREERQNAHPPG